MCSWASGEYFEQAFSLLDGIECGSFIKNIIRLNNIVNDLICLAHVCNNLELIPILREIEPLIIRDNVTIGSLYLETST